MTPASGNDAFLYSRFKILTYYFGNILVTGEQAGNLSGRRFGLQRQCTYCFSHLLGIAITRWIEHAHQAKFDRSFCSHQLFLSWY